MNRIRSATRAALAVALLVAGLGSAARAQGTRAYRLSDRQVDQIIRRIETRADSFRDSVNLALDRSAVDGTRAEDNINTFVRDFENATDQLRDRFNNRTSAAADVQEVLRRAAFINDFMARNRLTRRAQNEWTLLRSDLNALADAYGVAWNWAGSASPVGGGVSAQPYRLNDREVENIIRRIETNTDRFRDSVNLALDRSRIDGTRAENNINTFVRDFESATDQLRDRFNRRASVAGDVENVLSRAADIDSFVRNNRLTRRAEADWALLRTDLDALASAYGVAWNWNRNTGTPGGVLGGGVAGGSYGADARLTGTFRLDPSRSDDARAAADRATRTLPALERQRVYDRVVARLNAPELLAIERRGSSVTVASSRAPQTTFVADGLERTEQMPNGVTARVRAGLSGDVLTISSQGFRENDFTVTFEPLDNGRGLRVTRRIFSERLAQPVVVQNIYTRTSDVALWNQAYTGGDAGTFPGPTQAGAGGDFHVRDGELLVATLDNNLSTQTAQNGDRVTMTVRSPSQYEGAVIEGRLSNIDRGGRVAGRAGVTFDFDTIRLRDGRTFRFEGFVNEVRAANGETVRVDNEGTVESGSRTSETTQRAAIGTAVGAIIGAIAGGGKGAAIGAVIGAGAGAGSVYVQGKEDLELASGTELSIRASAPNTLR